MQRVAVVVAVLGVLHVGVGAGYGAPLVFSDRTAWKAAAGPADFLVDFSSITQDTSFAGTALDVGPFSLLGHPRPPAFTSPVYRVDVPPLSFSFSDFPETFAERAVIGYNDIPGQPDSADLLFDMPLVAWGADFWTSTIVDDVLGMDLYAEDGRMLATLLPLPRGGRVFFGFTVDPGDAVARLTFRSTGGPGGALWSDSVEIDNVEGVSRTIAEPSAFWLAGPGLVLAAWRARRRRSPTRQCVNGADRSDRPSDVGSRATESARPAARCRHSPWCVPCP